jgi:hypothetical protein
LVRLSNLSEKTKYYFKVGVTDPSFGDPNNNQAPYETTTAPQVVSSPTIDPIFGKINKVSGVPAAGAIVTWEADGASKLATLVKSDGSYVLPIATARSSNLSSFFNPSNGLKEQIVFNLAPEGKSTITCTFGADKPLPTVKLGENADCSNNGNTSDGTTAPATITTSSPETSGSGSTKARFTVPTQNSKFSVNTTSGSADTINVSPGQSFSTPFPTISGKVGPKQMVKIIVHSENPTSGTVIAGSDGSWSWTPPAGLAPGEHTVTITIVNADGTTQTITRNFNVNSGEPLLPLTSATPSARLSHLACVENACTTVDGSGVDSCSTNADCETATSPPVTGSEDVTLIVLLLGALFLFLSGGFLISNL